MRQRKYSLASFAFAAFYWLVDSYIHWFLFNEPEFELLPSDTNELWMRIAVFVLILCFGVYAD
jgi:hypothetical protein